MLPHSGVTAVRRVERPEHGEPGRLKGLPRTAVITTATMLIGFPHPAAERFSDRESLGGKGSVGNQTGVDRLRRIFPRTGDEQQAGVGMCPA